MDDTCDRCRKPLPSGGRVLYSGLPCTASSLIGRYGPACTRRVILKLAEHNMATYDDQGNQLTIRGGVVR